MSRYTSTTDDDLRAMLEAIGVGSLEELFDRQVPAGVRLGRALDLPAGLPEQDVYAHLRALAARNVSAEDEISFLGAGMYDHYVPALVDSIAMRSEFLTPYTPYQPEVSQGGLQVMFEYQTMISELTGLPVSNASAYEDLSLFKVTSSVDEAVEEITRFYRVYHSARTVGRRLVIRLTRPLPDVFVQSLSKEFADILLSGTIVQSAALAEEDEPELAALPRLVLAFNRTNFGRLRQLIDRINLDG